MAEVLDLKFEPTPDKPNATKLLATQGFQALSVCFAKDQKMPAHKHPNMNILLQVTAGAVELSSGSTNTAVTEGQIAFFSGDDLHALRNLNSGQSNIIVTAIPKST